MTVKSHAKFEEKLTCGLENDMSNLVLSWDPFVQSKKYMSYKFTEELCVMKLKNDDKSKEELTFLFKIDIRNLTKFDLSTRKSQKFAL